MPLSVSPLRRMRFVFSVLRSQTQIHCDAALNLGCSGDVPRTQAQPSCIYPRELSASSLACPRSASSRVRRALARTIACRASRSARSAFVNFFFAIVYSQKPLDLGERDRYVTHVEE